MSENLQANRKKSQDSVGSVWTFKLHGAFRKDYSPKKIERRFFKARRTASSANFCEKIKKFTAYLPMHFMKGFLGYLVFLWQDLK